MNDIAYDVKYEGFVPDEQLDNYVKFWIYSILDYCPYDSFVKVRVVSLTQRFLVEINVKYIHEQFFGLGEETTVAGALDASEKSLFDQIKQWRKNRFGLVAPVEKRMSVLLVDDDPFSTKIIETCLSEQGCDIYQVSSGEEAVYTLQKKQFNFVVMDWNMYPLSGRQTLKKMDSRMSINKGPDRKKLPVLTYSINSKDKINFPKTENLYQFAYLSKTSTFKSTFDTTKKLVDHLSEANNQYLN